jgi:hypothetical protein
MPPTQAAPAAWVRACLACAEIKKLAGQSQAASGLPSLAAMSTCQRMPDTVSYGMSGGTSGVRAGGGRAIAGAQGDEGHAQIKRPPLSIPAAEWGGIKRAQPRMHMA